MFLFYPQNHTEERLFQRPIKMKYLYLVDRKIKSQKELKSLKNLLHDTYSYLLNRDMYIGQCLIPLLL